MNIYIVIVTYNRLKYLRNTIDVSCKLDANILIIDNNSTDGTHEYLDEKSAQEKKVTVVHLPENTGGSGGFSFGIRQAVELGADWIWVMDDDVIPVENALEHILPYTRIAKCIYPAKEYADGSIYDFEAYVSRKTLKRTRISNIEEIKHKKYIDINGGCFEGAFFSRDVVKKIGLPDSRFFICWDDILWGMKAAEHVHCIYIKDVCIKKQFDKEKISVFKLKCYASTVFSRYHFFRNYWAAIYYLRNSGELSWLAYVRYFLELSKALGITLVIERDISGFRKILLGCIHGIKQKYVLFSSL